MYILYVYICICVHTIAKGVWPYWTFFEGFRPLNLLFKDDLIWNFNIDFFFNIYQPCGHARGLAAVHLPLVSLIHILTILCNKQEIIPSKQGCILSNLILYPPHFFSLIFFHKISGHHRETRFHSWNVYNYNLFADAIYWSWL